MSELKINKEKLVKACEKCSQVKQFAQEMWPEIFEEAKFKVGDIVEVIKEMSSDYEDLTGRIGSDHEDLTGRIGVVVSCIYKDKESVGIEFQEDISGHNCHGRAKEGHGWYVWPGNLKLLYRKP